MTKVKQAIEKLFRAVGYVPREDYLTFAGILKTKGTNFSEWLRLKIKQEINDYAKKNG